MFRPLTHWCTIYLVAHREQIEHTTQRHRAHSGVEPTDRPALPRYNTGERAPTIFPLCGDDCCHTPQYEQIKNSLFHFPALTLLRTLFSFEHTLAARARLCRLAKALPRADNVFVDNTRPVSPIERNHRSKRVSVGEKRYSFRTPFYELLPTFFFVTFLGHGQTTREAKKNFICTPKKVDFGSINVQEGPIAFRAIHMGLHSLLNERGYSA